MNTNSDGVFIFPEAARGTAGGIDTGLLALLSQNGGFGGNGNWLLVLFMWMMWQNGGFGNFRNQGGTLQDVMSQMNGDTGREFILQAMNGKFDCISQLVQMTNSNVETVKSVLATISSAIQNVTGQVNISALQTQNSVILGNANIARQIAECCCENRLAICEQTNALQRQADQNFAASQLQDANYNGEQRLAMSQQTNQILTSNQVTTQAVLDKISDQNVMITKQFCDLKEREYQSKIDTMGDIITQLRGQISNDNQDRRWTGAFNSIMERLTRIESHQPNTVPVQYPNIVAANATPTVGYAWNQCGGCGCGGNQSNFFN